MNILYDQKRTTIDRFEYTVNKAGYLDLRRRDMVDRRVEITFVNGKLDKVEHNICSLVDSDPLSAYRIMGAIAEKIEQLQQALNEERRRCSPPIVSLISSANSSLIFT